MIHSLARAKGGEIFVPRIPSMKIIDLAQAISPDAEHEVVGIRPGEKIHETLISEDEARNTIRFKECYLVQPNPRLREDLLKGHNGSKGETCSDNFRYASDNNNNWLMVEELQKLVKQISDDYAIEQSRWSMDDVPE